MLAPPRRPSFLRTKKTPTCSRSDPAGTKSTRERAAKRRTERAPEELQVAPEELQRRSSFKASAGESSRESSGEAPSRLLRERAPEELRRSSRESSGELLSDRESSRESSGETPSRLLRERAPEELQEQPLRRGCAQDIGVASQRRVHSYHLAHDGKSSSPEGDGSGVSLLTEVWPSAWLSLLFSAASLSLSLPLSASCLSDGPRCAWPACSAPRVNVSMCVCSHALLMRALCAPYLWRD